MKKIFSLILAIAFTLTLSAQNWTKEMQKDFRKSKDVAIVVDVSQTVVTCSNPNSKLSKEVIESLKKRLQYTLHSQLVIYRALPPVDEKKAKYVVRYIMTSLTDKGGFRGCFYVSMNNNKSAINAFHIDDGKWNSTETLITENVEKYIRCIKSRKELCPYNVKLYKY